MVSGTPASGAPPPRLDIRDAPCREIRGWELVFRNAGGSAPGMGFPERKAAAPQYPHSPPPTGSLRRGWHPSALPLWVSRGLRGNPEAGGAQSRGFRGPGGSRSRRAPRNGSRGIKLSCEGSQAPRGAAMGKTWGGEGNLLLRNLLPRFFLVERLKCTKSSPAGNWARFEEPKKTRVWQHLQQAPRLALLLRRAPICKHGESSVYVGLA